MNRIDELVQNGRDAREAGRVDEAAIFYEEAYKLAKELKIFDTAANCGVHAVHNLLYSGNRIRALSLILDIFQLNENNLESKDYIYLKIRYWEIQTGISPNYDKQLLLLKELKKFSTENEGLIISSIFLNYSIFFYSTGEYTKALEFLEKAWSSHADLDYIKHAYCSTGIQLNLTLGNLRAAERWLSLYSEDNSNVYSKKISELCDNIDIHLFKDQNHATVFGIISRLDDYIAGFKEVRDLTNAKRLIVRINLLKTSLGDPFHHLHPSKIILLDRELAKQNWGSFLERHNRNKLLIDYRLACLRFVLNIKPVDDLWYKFNQNLSINFNTTKPEKIKIRIKKVQIAISYAKILAKDFDKRLKCNKYIVEINERENRMNDILEKLNNIL